LVVGAALEPAPVVPSPLGIALLLPSEGSRLLVGGVGGVEGHELEALLVEPLALELRLLGRGA
jgi:hypothetical protein